MLHLYEEELIGRRCQAVSYQRHERNCVWGPSNIHDQNHPLTYNIYDRGIFIFYICYDPIFWYFSEHSCTWNVNYLICMQYFHNWTGNMQYLTTTAYCIYLLLFSFSKQYLTTAAYWLLFTFYVFQAGSEQPVICSRWWQEGKFHVLWNIHKEYNVSVVCLTIGTRVDVCSSLTLAYAFVRFSYRYHGTVWYYADITLVCLSCDSSRL
jgi:ABC-type glycerol-3-phosphate transport system permease component